MNCNGGAFFAWISTTFVWRVKGGLKGQRIGPAPRHSRRIFDHAIPTRCRVNVGLAPNMSIFSSMNPYVLSWMPIGAGSDFAQALVWPVGNVCTLDFLYESGVCVGDYVAIPYFGISLSLSVLASRWPGLLWSCSFKTMTSLFCMWLTGCSTFYTSPNQGANDP